MDRIDKENKITEKDKDKIIDKLITYEEYIGRMLNNFQAPHGANISMLTCSQTMLTCYCLADTP